MSQQPEFSDMMRVEVRDLDGHLIRVLDLRIERDIVLQGDQWKPGVVVPVEEKDFEAEVIAYALNEGSGPFDADGLPVGAGDELEDGDDQATARWAAERVPIGTPRPPLSEWLADPAPRP